MANLSSRLLSIESPATPGEALLKRTAIAAAVTIALFSVYFRMFSRFTNWDDEGFVMFGVRYFLSGHRLYDEIYSQYGPFYYLVQWFYYTIVHQPVSHDSVRIFAVVLCLGSATLLAWCIRRLTGSWILAGFTYFAILKVLVAFAAEPGHPQDLCLLLVACLLAVCCGVDKKVALWQAAMLGFLLSALALTKINIGFYAALALLLVLSKTSSSAFARKTLYWLTGLLSIVAVVAIMFPLMDLSWDRGYCLMMVFSILAVLITVFVTPLDVLRSSQAWRLLAFAAAVSGVLILLPFLIKGTTLPAFLWMTILQHKNFARNWYYPLPTGIRTTIYSAASLALSILWVWSRRKDALHERVSFYLQAAKGPVGLMCLAAASIGGNPGLIRSPLFTAITPLIWLILISPSAQNIRDTALARVSLSLLALYMGMYAFPVAGTQVSFALAVLLVTSSLFIHDSWVTLASRFNGLLSPGFRRPALACLLLMMGILYARRLKVDYEGYESLSPLNLPGAQRVRLEVRDRDTYHWLVDQLNARCDTFFSMPGILSLYFWTKHEPPTLLLAGEWMNLFSDRQQQAVVDALSRYKRPCIVYNPHLVEFWRRGQDLSRAPLAVYIKDQFISIEERNGYYFMVRKFAWNQVSPTA